MIEPPENQRRKYWYDGGRVEIAAHLVYELDPDGRQLRAVRQPSRTITCLTTV